MFLKSITYFFICSLFSVTANACQSENVSPKTGAGIFLMTSINQRTYALLAQRSLLHKVDEQGWVNPGGEQDPGESLAMTAARETAEELFYLFNFDDKEVAKLPFVTTTAPSRNFTYTMYFAMLANSPRQAINAERLLRESDAAKDTTQRELVDFAWIPMQEIMANLSENTFQSTALDGRLLNIQLLKGLNLSLTQAIRDSILTPDGDLVTSGPLLSNKPLQLSPDVNTLVSLQDLSSLLSSLYKVYSDHAFIVCFDLDNTLIEYKNKQFNLTESEAIANLFQKMKMRLMSYYGLTARSYRCKELTNTTLDKLNIEFRKIPQCESIKFNDSTLNGVGYDNGVFYCGHNSKASIMAKILEARQEQPIVCLFIDDLYKNVSSMAHFFTTTPETIVGLTYHYVSPQFKAAFSKHKFIAEKDRKILAQSCLAKLEVLQQLQRQEIKVGKPSALSLNKHTSSMTLNYMRLILKDTYLPGISPDIIFINVKRMLELHDLYYKSENEAAQIKYDSLKDSSLKPPTKWPTNLSTNLPLAKQLTSFILRELDFPGHTPLYHAAFNNIGFMTLVYTEILEQLQGFLPEDNTIVLRLFSDALKMSSKEANFESGCKSRAEIDDVHILQTVMNKRLEKYKDKKLNFLPGYGDIAISVNWFLFGNNYNSSSDTLLYYITNNSCHKKGLMALLLSTFQQLSDTGPDSLISHIQKNYIEALYDPYVEKSCGWLSQIFIPDHKIDSACHLAQIYGYEHIIPSPENKSHSMKPSAFKSWFMANPGEFEHYLSSNKSGFTHTNTQIDNVLGGDLPKTSLLQGRLLLHPKTMLSEHTHIFQSEIIAAELKAEFLKKLRLQVRHDLAHWLTLKAPLSGTRLGLNSSTLKSQYYFDLVELGTSGDKYQADEKAIRMRQVACLLFHEAQRTYQTLSPTLVKGYLGILEDKNPYMTNNRGKLSSVFREAIYHFSDNKVSIYHSGYSVARQIVHHYAYNYPEQNIIKIITNPEFFETNFDFIEKYITNLIEHDFVFSQRDYAGRTILDILSHYFNQATKIIGSMGERILSLLTQILANPKQSPLADLAYEMPRGLPPFYEILDFEYLDYQATKRFYELLIPQLCNLHIGSCFTDKGLKDTLTRLIELRLNNPFMELLKTTIDQDNFSQQIRLSLINQLHKELEQAIKLLVGLCDAQIRNAPFERNLDLLITMTSDYFTEIVRLDEKILPVIKALHGLFLENLIDDLDIYKDQYALSKKEEILKKMKLKLSLFRK